MEHAAIIMPVQDFIGWVAEPDRGSAPRVMLVVAHPGDVVPGIGSRLHRLGGGLTLVYVTSGSPPIRGELAAILDAAAIAPRRVHSLGIREDDASFHLARIGRTLAALIAATRPVVVLTQSYEGGHPDHDATAFVVHAACALAERRDRYAGRPPDRCAAPAVFEMLSYHHRDGGMTAGDFIPHAGVEVLTIRLTAEDRDRKRRLMACGGSLEAERFRPAPRYSFTRPPHDGILRYERTVGGMTGPHWRVLAGLAAAELAGAP